MARSIERSWHMIAEGDDGPFIPSMAAEAIVRRSLDGRPPRAGRADGGHASWSLPITWRCSRGAGSSAVSGTRMPADAPLYRRLLGDAWTALPEPVRAMHELTGTLIASGRATVERGAGLLARLVAAVMGFPRAGRDCPGPRRFSPRGRP